MVYSYAELVKMEEAFIQAGGLYQPRIVLGAGDGNGNSRGYIYKEQDDLLMRFVNSAGNNVDLKFTDDGFVDAKHRRLKSCYIDSNSGTIAYTVEEDDTVHGLLFEEDGDTVKYIWEDGFECEVTIT